MIDSVAGYLVRIAKNLTGDDVERILTTPQKGYEEVTVHNSPCRGYLLSDGQWLDIGGQDHRFINGMVKFDKRTEESFGYTNTKKMHYIMKLAKLIRFIPESRVFQTLTKPTRDQVHEIVKYCERHGKIEVGFGLKTPREYSSKATYELEDDLSSYNGE